MRITFDTNSLMDLVAPKPTQRPQNREAAANVQDAIAAGVLWGFFCETLVTLEGVQRHDRQQVFGNTRVEAEFPQLARIRSRFPWASNPSIPNSATWFRAHRRSAFGSYERPPAWPGLASKTKTAPSSRPTDQWSSFSLAWTTSTTWRRCKATRRTCESGCAWSRISRLR